MAYAILNLPSIEYASTSSPFPFIAGPGLSNTTTEGVGSAGLDNYAEWNGSNYTYVPRTYSNPPFNLSLQYPSTWSAIELKTNTRTLSAPALGSSTVVVISSPFEGKLDQFRERALVSVQDLSPGDIDLANYTNSSLASYRNLSNDIRILESDPTTLGGQPGHRIVYTDVDDVKLKKIQVWTIVDNSKAYVITFASEEPKYAYYLPQVENIISSFKLNNTNNNNNNNTVRLTTTSPLASAITSLSSDVPPLALNTLEHSDRDFGIKIDYPRDWTKVQPALPSDDRKFATILSFIAPNQPAFSNSINSSSNASRAVINIGINNFGTSFMSALAAPNNNDDGFTNITLDEYTHRQIANLNQTGALITMSNQTRVGGLPAHEATYETIEGTNVAQVWVVNEGKAYHISLFANNSDILAGNLPIFHNMVNSIEFT